MMSYTFDDSIRPRMKKAKSRPKRATAATSRRSSSTAKATENDESNKNQVVDLDDEDTGFGTWLKSGTGVEWMRLFVIGNSLAVFLTMTWPQMQKVFEIVKDVIYGGDLL